MREDVVAGAGEVETVNPATGSVLARYERMSAQEIDARLDGARAAFLEWRARSFQERAHVLQALARALREQRDDLAALAVAEMGKPIAQARSEVEKCAWACEYFAEHAQRHLADEIVESSAAQSLIAYRPLGVIFAIMPWNFPYWQVFRAAAPALMAGNAFVLKHADNTTGCGLAIARLFETAKAPANLFQTLLIDHADADARIADPRIAAVSLTGSERAGTAVGAAAGAAIKPCVLELGGSDAFIVLADADLDLAIETALTARFQNNGQSCIAAKRFIVEEPVYDRFVRHFAQGAAALRVGDPASEQTQLGPCARADLRETLHAQVTQSVVDGARIATGGSMLPGPGFFLEPTVVTDVVPGMPLFNEESFGPAAAVIRARDEEEALNLANASAFGLGASIWTRDVGHAQRMAAHIEAGMVFVNGMVASDPRLPFGGIKRSGYGRELSALGIREFVNAQTLWIGPAHESA